jgi:hypothetical protein
MVAQAATPDRLQSPRRDPALLSLAHAVLASATLVLLAVAAWLCGRRLAGELQQPLHALSLLAVGVVAAALMSGLRCGWWQAGVRPTHPRSLAAALWLLPSLAALLLAATVSVRGASVTALALLWVILLLHEVLWGRFVWRSRVTRGTNAQRGALPSTPDPFPADKMPSESQGRPADGSDDHELSLPGDVCQQITRSQSQHHGDAIAGVLRALFQPGERSRNLHVAFCPPMRGRPLVEVVQLSGPRTRVKAADIQSFGVRFDLRLATVSAQEEDVLIHFEARCGA